MNLLNRYLKSDVKIDLRLLVLCLFILLTNSAKSQDISPMLVGNNAWFTNPTDEVWALTGECGVKTIRIGGNGFNDNMPSNSTLLSWVNKIRGIGAEPIIQVSQHQSAAAAAAVVKYFNVDLAGEIDPIKYWNIGNEPWLEANRPPTSEVGALVEAYFKPIAEAMKAVDPTIKIYGPDFAYYIEDAIDDLFGGDNDIAGKIPGQDYYYCDGLSWHRYPQDDNINLAYQGIEDFRTSIVKCKTKVDAINATYNRTGDDALEWGIGEYNAKNGPVVHTWENGQMFGGILGMCMKYEAKYAATWSMFENGGNRQGTDYSFIDGDNMTPRSSYRHMQFVAQHFTGTYLDGTTTNNDIFIYGAQNGAKTSVMIMNRDSGKPLKYTLHLNTAADTGDEVILNVNGNLDNSYADIIGERTTHVLVFEGESITKHSYSSYHFDNQLPPVETILGSATEPPSVPSNFGGSSPSYDQITLTWTDNADNETGFLIEKSIDGSFEIIGIAEANITSFSDNELQASTAYTYRVVAYNSIGQSAYSETINITTAEAPAQVAFKGPHTIPGKIQIEDYNAGGQNISYFDLEEENRGGQYRIAEWVDLETCTDEGGGYNVGYVTPGEWLKYLISDVEEGNYTIAFRLASNSTETAPKKINIKLNNTSIGTISPANTGGWQEWQTVSIDDIAISAGSDQILELSFEGSGFNINWMEFIETSIVTGLLPIDTKNVSITYFSEDDKLQIDASKSGQDVKIQLFDLNGKSHLEFTIANKSNIEYSLCGLPDGLFIVRMVIENKVYNTKIVKK